MTLQKFANKTEIPVSFLFPISSEKYKAKVLKL